MKKNKDRLDLKLKEERRNNASCVNYHNYCTNNTCSGNNNISNRKWASK